MAMLGWLHSLATLDNHIYFGFVIQFHVISSLAQGIFVEVGIFFHTFDKWKPFPSLWSALTRCQSL
jgi:hypothetical protein